MTHDLQAAPPPGKRALGRARREHLEDVRRRTERRVKRLRQSVEAGETMLASGPHVLVTDRRVIFLDVGLYRSRSRTLKTSDTVRFEEITAWTLGRRHDRRPLLRLEHAPHVREEWIPAHRFLRFRWGNATGPVTHMESTLPFNRNGDPELKAIVSQLVAKGVPRGDDFTEALPGTREERRGAVRLYERVD